MPLPSSPHWEPTTATFAIVSLHAYQRRRRKTSSGIPAGRREPPPGHLNYIKRPEESRRR
ncbi:hypothetical protein SAE02_44430 [Skermanella aerolata]|uniref:Uncharacterized protein n=1 Tax=Skermanella aerolata TaxID=393310 RepID=A0A512DV05_9PROT|nr:hypothetical protein SAE02_44430 [Skermanella aerolata]